MNERRVGVIGASSLVGQFLLPLLCERGWSVTAFSRVHRNTGPCNVQWRQLLEADSTDSMKIRYWISLAPIWTVPSWTPLLERHVASRVVALSSTSRFVKTESSNPAEREQARLLALGEQQLQEWAAGSNAHWLVLRPTLIYGLGLDGNISEVARFIRRFGFFPTFGAAQGLRQPVHARDVAKVCATALERDALPKRAYDISGGETLTYRQMVERVFTALGKRSRVMSVPLWAARLGIPLLRMHPKYHHWSVATAARMNQNLAFDHADAARDLGYSPSLFLLQAADLACQDE